MTAVFADTYYYLALVSENDDAHASAVEISRTLGGRTVTTAWVLTAVGDAMASPAQRPIFLALLESLRADPAVQIVPASDDLFNQGVALYASRPDKEWSLTDCISFTVMTQLGLCEECFSTVHLFLGKLESGTVVGVVGLHRRINPEHVPTLGTVSNLARSRLLRLDLLLARWTTIRQPLENVADRKTAIGRTSPHRLGNLLANPLPRVAPEEEGFFVKGGAGAEPTGGNPPAWAGAEKPAQHEITRIHGLVR